MGDMLRRSLSLHPQCAPSGPSQSTAIRAGSEVQTAPQGEVPAVETWREPVLTGPTLRPDDHLLQSPHPEEKQQERAPQQIYPILFLEIQPRSQRQWGRCLATLSPKGREQVWAVQRAGWCLRLVISSSSSGLWVHCVLVGTPPPSRGTVTWTHLHGEPGRLGLSRGLRSAQPGV